MSRKLLLSLLALGLLTGSLVAADALGGGTTAVPALVKAVYNKQLKKTILVDGRGLTLYAFSFDDAGKPTCGYEDAGYKCVPSWPSCIDDGEYHCVKLWPPFVTGAKPRAGSGVNPKLLSVVRRRDGHLQVVYNHHPLYFYKGAPGTPSDKKPGDVNGQNFEGLWWVVSPAGKEIRS